ncbi:MAG: hypothetical protein GY865_13085 [candidate division Zixibacteria bacterium]|nr:hypothetical protein [candidate division Zixibacteria bacterium]MCP4705528.1 hypothetical protein [candidate division Zixibacteria bacterium]
MTLSIKRANYYHTIVDNKHGKGYWLLEHFRQKGVSLEAFVAFPLGGGRSQLDFVVKDVEILRQAALEAKVKLTGPKRAFMAQGDDEVGAIVELHQKLTAAEINIHAGSGLSGGAGSFCYLFWVNSDDYEDAALALGV